MATKLIRKVKALDWLRRVCSALPGVEEKLAWGHPTFLAGGRTIAAFEVIRARPSIAVLADSERQQSLIDDFGFFKTPYSGRYGWVSAWVDVPAPYQLLSSLLVEAYQAASASPRRSSPVTTSSRKPRLTRTAPNRSKLNRPV